MFKVPGFEFRVSSFGLKLDECSLLNQLFALRLSSAAGGSGRQHKEFLFLQYFLAVLNLILSVQGTDSYRVTQGTMIVAIS